MLRKLMRMHSQDLPEIGPSLAQLLTQRFAEGVLVGARLPEARRQDVEGSLTFAVEAGRLTCTCDITGTTYERPWDGKEQTAQALVDEASESTAYLVTTTRHYAWLRASR